MYCDVCLSIRENISRIARPTLMHCNYDNMLVIWYREETWWWNEEVAEAVRNKKIKYAKWKKENTEEARMEYKKSRQNAKRVISSATTTTTTV